MAIIHLYTCHASHGLYAVMSGRSFFEIAADLAREFGCDAEDFQSPNVELPDGDTPEIVTLNSELVGCFDRPLTNDEADYIDAILSAPIQFQQAAE